MTAYYRLTGDILAQLVKSGKSGPIARGGFQFGSSHRPERAASETARIVPA